MLTSQRTVSSSNKNKLKYVCVKNNSILVKENDLATITTVRNEDEVFKIVRKYMENASDTERSCGTLEDTESDRSEASGKGRPSKRKAEILSAPSLQKPLDSFFHRDQENFRTITLVRKGRKILKR